MDCDWKTIISLVSLEPIRVNPGLALLSVAMLDELGASSSSDQIQWASYTTLLQLLGGCDGDRGVSDHCDEDEEDLRALDEVFYSLGDTVRWDEPEYQKSLQSIIMRSINNHLDHIKSQTPHDITTTATTSSLLELAQAIRSLVVSTTTTTTDGRSQHPLQSLWPIPPSPSSSSISDHDKGDDTLAFSQDPPQSSSSGMGVSKWRQDPHCWIDCVEGWVQKLVTSSSMTFDGGTGGGDGGSLSNADQHMLGEEFAQLLRVGGQERHDYVSHPRLHALACKTLCRRTLEEDTDHSVLFSSPSLRLLKLMMAVLRTSAAAPEGLSLPHPLRYYLHLPPKCDPVDHLLACLEAPRIRWCCEASRWKEVGDGLRRIMSSSLQGSLWTRRVLLQIGLFEGLPLQDLMGGRLRQEDDGRRCCHCV